MLSTGGERKSQLCIEWHLHSVTISLTCDYLLHVFLHPLERTAVRRSTHSRLIKCSVDRFSTRLRLFYWRLFINDENTLYHSTLRPLLNISQSHITITRTAQNTHCLLGILKSICFPGSPDLRVSYPRTIRQTATYEIFTGKMHSVTTSSNALPVSKIIPHTLQHSHKIKWNINCKMLQLSLVSTFHHITIFSGCCCYILRESHTMQNVLWSRASVCLSVCVSVRGRMPTLLHGPGCNLGEW